MNKSYVQQKVIGASISYEDPEYPVIITTMTDRNKLSRDEAVNLIRELTDAVNRIDIELVNELK